MNSLTTVIRIIQYLTLTATLNFILGRASPVDIPPAQGPLVTVKPRQGSCTRAAIIVSRLRNVKAGGQSQGCHHGQSGNRGAISQPDCRERYTSDNAGALRATVNP
jgi:hypothetical protein